MTYYNAALYVPELTFKQEDQYVKSENIHSEHSSKIRMITNINIFTTYIHLTSIYK